MTAIDVLAIAAHPDDAEVGCAGALLVAADSGARTGIVDLTLGEASTRGTPAERDKERAAASDLLGLEVRLTAGLPDGAVGTDPDHRLAVVTLLRQCRPRIVLAPYPDDRHPDHAAAGRLARDACYFARVANVGDDPPHSVDHLYHYMLHEPFTPSFVVDISPVWDRKLAAIGAYASQFGADGEASTQISHPQFLRYLEARAVVHGAMVGAAWGEPYHHHGPLRFDRLPAGTRDPSQPYRMFV